MSAAVILSDGAEVMDCLDEADDPAQTITSLDNVAIKNFRSMQNNSKPIT